MLIKRAVLDRIVGGKVDTLFRRQRRPTVRTGGSLRTAVGVLRIIAVDEVDEQRISPADARRAGFASTDEQRSELNRRSEGTVYRVRVEYGGVDPRLALRSRSDITDGEWAEVVERLDRFDRRSPHGAWTQATLELIAGHPHVRAPDLAAMLGRETTPFKTDVRKLKELGLTVSHSPGYELSPRGAAVLERLRRKRR